MPLTVFEVVSVIIEEALHRRSVLYRYFLCFTHFFTTNQGFQNRSLETPWVQKLCGNILLQEPKLETVTSMLSVNQC